MLRAERTFSDKKINYFEKVHSLLDNNNKIIVVGIENVTSAQVHQTRIDLRGKAEVLMGKNTMIKKVLADRREKSDRDALIYEKLVLDRVIKNKVGLIFTNGDLKEIKDVLDKNRIQAPARQGAIAPVDVMIPAGNTGLEPTKTSFFQALNIATKITKGTVEILKDVQIITTGDKVGSSESTLCQMLHINPFFYAMTVQSIYDNGSVYGAWVLDITPELMTEKVSLGISRLTAFSLGSGIPTKASFPHVVRNAFKNLLAVSVGTDYTFDEFNGASLKDAVLNGPDPATLAAAAASSAPAAAAKKEEEEEEEDDEMGFGLFD